jgi:hypothetical protein
MLHFLLVLLCSFQFRIRSLFHSRSADKILFNSRKFSFVLHSTTIKNKSKFNKKEIENTSDNLFHQNSSDQKINLPISSKNELIFVTKLPFRQDNLIDKFFIFSLSYLLSNLSTSTNPSNLYPGMTFSDLVQLSQVSKTSPQH